MMVSTEDTRYDVCEPLYNDLVVVLPVKHERIQWHMEYDVDDLV